LTDEFYKIQKTFNKKATKTQAEINDALNIYKYPKGIILPKTSDVNTIEQLFNPLQLAQLAYLKHLIMQVKPADIRGTLLLMFSGLLNKINLTYHPSSVRAEGGGDSGPFRYYRYRLAPHPVMLDIMRYFESRLKDVSLQRQNLPLLLILQRLIMLTLLKHQRPI
jgi:hypothetical protein